jgi:hypothetical protein
LISKKKPFDVMHNRFTFYGLFDRKQIGRDAY